MIYLFKIYLLVTGLVPLVTLMMVLAVLITEIVIISIGKAAKYVLILERRFVLSPESKPPALSIADAHDLVADEIVQIK